jgi:hypothetical protein
MSHPPVCVWCLRVSDDPVHTFGAPMAHPFVGPRQELTPRQLAKCVAAELRQIARETFGYDARVSDALDVL